VHIALLPLCLLAQVLCTALPSGAPLCVRSLLTWESRAQASVAAPTSQSGRCGGCCCEDVHDLAAEPPSACCQADPPAGKRKSPSDRAPCRNPKCLLCVSAPDLVMPGRCASHDDTCPVTWAVAAEPARNPGDEQFGTREHRGRPPPDILSDRSRRIVGPVVLQV
jgi:hypothetical protein